MDQTQTPPTPKPRGRPRKPPQQPPQDQQATQQPDPRPAQDQGSINPAALQGIDPPKLPPELAAQLSPRDLALVLRLSQGLTWAQAQAACHIRSRARKAQPPERIKNATEWQVRNMIEMAGVTQSWVMKNMVELYGRASGLADMTIVSRHGLPVTGRHWDGATARACLELLGLGLGMFGGRKQNGSQLPVDTVGQLLRAVAQRGKPSLPGDQARTVDVIDAVQTPVELTQSKV